MPIQFSRYSFMGFASSIYSGKVQESPTMHNNDFCNQPRRLSLRQLEITISHSVPLTRPPLQGHDPIASSVSITTAYLLIKVICCSVPSVLLRILSNGTDGQTVIQLDTITGLATGGVGGCAMNGFPFQSSQLLLWLRCEIFEQHKGAMRVTMEFITRASQDDEQWRIPDPSSSSVPLVFALSL